MGSEVDFRRATPADAEHIAKILGRGNRVDLSFLPDLHSEEEDLNFTRDTILKNYDVWVATDKRDRPVGFISFKDNWVHQFYVHSDYQKRGVGKQLMQKAKESFDTLQLWTFQKSELARAFYESQGFLAINFTDGKDNDEKEPDVTYFWKRNPL